MGLFSGFSFGGLGRGISDSGGDIGRGLGGGASGALGRNLGGGAASGALGRNLGGTPVRPPGTGNDAARAADAADPNVKEIPSREAGQSFFDNLKPGDVWKPLLGLAIVGTAVTITALMLDNSRKGAGNNGKTYNVTKLKNKGSSGNIIECTFSPSVEPNGVVKNDSVRFSGTGTFLDGNSYTITTETNSHSTIEFDGRNRLSGEVTNKGSFVLTTSFQNHMDDQAARAAALPADVAGDVLGAFFDNFLKFFQEGPGGILCLIVLCACMILGLVMVFK